MLRFVTIVLLHLSLNLTADVQEQRMGYKENVPWEKRNGQGYDGYYKVAVKQEIGQKEKTAEWTVDLPAVDKTYAVYATWVADKANTRNATYTVYDGEKGLGQVQANQQQPPRGKTVNSATFQRLGSFRFTSRIIRIVLSSQTDGNVVSDSVLVLPEP